MVFWIYSRTISWGISSSIVLRSMTHQRPSSAEGCCLDLGNTLAFSGKGQYSIIASEGAWRLEVGVEDRITVLVGSC